MRYGADADLEPHARILVIADRIVLREVARVDMRRRPPAEDQRLAVSIHGVSQLTAQPRREAERSGPVGRQPHGNHTRRMARDDLARVVDGPDPKPGRGNSVTQIERAAVVGGDVPVLERQDQVPQRQIGLRVRTLKALGQRVGLDELPGSHRAAHLRQDLSGLRVAGVFRPAGPERVVIELQALGPDAPENHCAESAAANRKRLDPFLRGPRVFQDQGRRCGHRRPGLCGGEIGAAHDRQRRCRRQQLLEEVSAVHVRSQNSEYRSQNPECHS